MGTQSGLIQRKRQMIDLALRQHKEIFPCANRQKLDECFTDDENRLFFWFNTRDESTHVLSMAKRGRCPKMFVSERVEMASQRTRRHRPTTAPKERGAVHGKVGQPAR